MRRIGTTPNRATAQRFCDYLETQSIAAKMDVDAAPDEPHDIWVREESDVDTAKSILTQFNASPDDSKYNAADKATVLRRQREKEIARKLDLQTKAQRKVGRTVGRGGPGGGIAVGSIPVTIAVIALATLVSFATSFGNPRPNRDGRGPSTEQTIFSALSCVDLASYRATDNQWISLQRGEVWRLISPMFLHGATFHLLFNMMALYTLGSVVERIHGSGFLAGLLIVSQIGATLLQMGIPMLQIPALTEISGLPIAIGASGAVFGVFGFIWIRPMVQPGYPVEIPPINVALMLGFLVVCFTPWVPGIANGAHVGGLLIGVAVAAAWPKS